MVGDLFRFHIFPLPALGFNGSVAAFGFEQLC